MTVSLAEGGAGLGTAWGEQAAQRMLRGVGFTSIEVVDVPGPQKDFMAVLLTLDESLQETSLARPPFGMHFLKTCFCNSSHPPAPPMRA